MKKKIAVALFFGCFAAITAHAQDSGNVKKDTYPYHIISKEVQRIRYKNTEHVPARITTADPVQVRSKGISRMHVQPAKKEGKKVSTGGFPTWTITKGVARRQAER